MVWVFDLNLSQLFTTSATRSHISFWIILLYIILFNKKLSYMFNIDKKFAVPMN